MSGVIFANTAVKTDQQTFTCLFGLWGNSAPSYLWPLFSTNNYIQLSTMISKTFYLYFAVLVAVAMACTNDVLPPPERPEFCNDIIASYNTNVKPIIDESCAYSGCHDGAGGTGPGNYKSYNGILSILDDGSFRNRVLEKERDPLLGMPPDNSIYPESQKDDLTEEELQIIECWLNEGYPKE
ncbi:MAG: hypothetical protein R2825_03660 [Saprospiraceae bacterium]